jgi:hypothetical protein
MNAIAAISQALLRGEILTIKTAFRDFGVSNLPREVGRSVERKFGVRISKLQKEGKSRFGVPVYFYEYRLNKDDPINKSGIEIMRQYVQDNGGEVMPAKRPVGRPRNEPTVNTNNSNKLF